MKKAQKTLDKPKPNIVPWLDFFLSVVYQQSKLAVELLSKENIEKLLSPKQIAVWEYLQTVDEASPKDISQNAKVALLTVAQALGKLIRLKKVERIGLGRSTRYRKL